MTSERFREGMSELGKWFRREVSNMVAEAYWLTCKHLSDSEWAQAVGLALANSKGMPTATELIEMVGGHVGKGKDAAELAWVSVVDAVKHHGAYASVSFEDRAISATIQSMGGWQDLCHKEGDDFWVWARKQFTETYTACLRSGVRGPEKLAGIIEQTNSLKGKLDMIPAAVPILASARKQLE